MWVFFQVKLCQWQNIGLGHIPFKQSFFLCFPHSQLSYLILGYTAKP